MTNKKNNQSKFKSSNRKTRAVLNLSNYPKKLKGTTYRYIHKINVHKCCFNDAIFQRVRYRAGHITASLFRRAIFNNVDFIFVNLKSCNFKKAKFCDVLFYGCDLTEVDFSGSTFKNVYLVNCKLPNAIKEKVIVVSPSQIQPSQKLADMILTMRKNTSLEKYNILTTTNHKINNSIISILISLYSEQKLIQFFKKITITNKNQMYTMHDYIYSIDKYYKK